MSKTEKSKINYIIICIDEFANKFNKTKKEAYLYLKKYKGIEFLIENYQAEHMVSLDDTMDDLKQICTNNGGKI